MTPRRRVSLAHSDATRYLYGLEFAPLDARFPKAHQSARPGERGTPRLFVCFGGRDPTAITSRFVQALDAAGFRGPATIVADPDPVGRAQIASATARWDGTEVLHSVSDMAAPMACCDLVATKMGLGVLEAFCLGLPCVLVEPSAAHVALHEEIALAYSDLPAVECGLASDVDFAAAAAAALELSRDRPRLATAGRRAAELVDGRGIDRILDALTG
jgi:spore coat polysaccharide biosynthesis predicted glycosyltransferase SpsG